eukprot:m.170651 g.170651  ORF g.170651 m.170651 type:complete len:1136 (-) comp16695_c0_seq3:167-3574(-)
MASPHRRAVRSRSNSTGAIPDVLDTTHVLEAASSRLAEEASDRSRTPSLMAKLDSDESSLATTPTAVGKATFGPIGDTLKTLETVASLSREQGKDTHAKTRPRSKSDPNLKETKADVHYITSLPTWQDGHDVESPPDAAPSDSEMETRGSQLVRLLIIAMERKVMAKPMQAILKHLSAYADFEIMVLSEQLLFDAPVEHWPLCDCLIAFYSGGLEHELGSPKPGLSSQRYPLSKVESYVELRKPFVLNDLALQHSLLDRREVYEILEKNDIPVPPYAILDRTNDPDVDVTEREDAIEINGQVVPKPFVMKPVDAENHNIFVYFSQLDGGGAQHLYRKKKDKASTFLPEKHTIPEEGDFVFEHFLPTGGTDIKVYTVGPNYAHAEGRKAPVVDGKVLRDGNGKEIRCPILLTAYEKDIARKVTQAFKQNVCGFDLLRTSDNKSFVCDVNGWSFVKRSAHYYVDCARILRQMILEATNPSRLQGGIQPTPALSLSVADNAMLAKANSSEPAEPELRCVIALIRHSDRTPKEKLKMVVDRPELLELFEKWSPAKLSARKELKLKSRKHLQDVLNRVQQVMRWKGLDEEQLSNFKQIEHVLTRWPISGINRKVQLKPVEWVTTSKGKSIIVKAQLVVKWGGEVTPQGLKLAQKAGVQFRESMYPSSGEGDTGLLRLHSTYRHDLKLYSSDEGRVQMTAAAFAKGLLQLDGEITPILVSLVRKDKAVNTLLDDTKAARETMDRVKKTLHAALSQDIDSEHLMSQIAPLNTLAFSQRAALKRLGNPRKAMHSLYTEVSNFVTALDEKTKQEPALEAYQKEPLVLMLRRWKKLEDEFYDPVKDKYAVSKIPDIYDSIKYHLQHNAHFEMPQCAKVMELSQALADVVVPQEYGISNEDKLSIARDIGHDFFKKLLHDLKVSAGKETKHALFQHEVSHRLKSGHDSFIQVRSPERHVRTRLYFTSESHIHALVNLLRVGDYGAFAPVSRDRCSSNPDHRSSLDPVSEETSPTPKRSHLGMFRKRSQSELSPRLPPRHGVADHSVDDDWARSKEYICRTPELGYLTHVVCRLFERHDVDAKSPERFFVEWSFSPGLETRENLDVDSYLVSDVQPADMRKLHSGMSLNQVEAFFSRVGKSPDTLSD